MTKNTDAEEKKVDLKDEINRLMTPSAAKELQNLSPTFQQFLIRWTDLKDMAMMEEMKEFVQGLYENDNAELCKNVATIVSKEVAETLFPIWKKLETLITSQEDIFKHLQAMDERLVAVEREVIIIKEDKLKKFEEHIKLIPRIYRSLIIIIISVILSLISFFFMTNGKINNIQKILNNIELRK